MQLTKVLPISDDLLLPDAISSDRMPAFKSINPKTWAINESGRYTKDGHFLASHTINIEFYYENNLSTPVGSLLLGAMLPIPTPETTTAKDADKTSELGSATETPKGPETILAAFFTKCEENIPKTIERFWKSKDEFQEHMIRHFYSHLANKLLNSEHNKSDNTVQTLATNTLKVLLPLDSSNPGKVKASKSRSCNNGFVIDDSAFEIIISQPILDKASILFKNSHSFEISANDTQVKFGDVELFDKLAGLLYELSFNIFEGSPKLTDALVEKHLPVPDDGVEEAGSIPSWILNVIADNWSFFFSLFAGYPQKASFSPTNKCIWGIVQEAKLKEQGTNGQHTLCVFYEDLVSDGASSDSDADEKGLKRFILLNCESTSASEIKESVSEAVKGAVADEEKEVNREDTDVAGQDVGN